MVGEFHVQIKTEQRKSSILHTDSGGNTDCF